MVLIRKTTTTHDERLRQKLKFSYLPISICILCKTFVLFVCQSSFNTRTLQDLFAFVAKKEQAITNYYEGEGIGKR